MFQRHDHLLHERGDPLRSLIVNDLLELLAGNTRERIERFKEGQSFLWSYAQRTQSSNRFFLAYIQS